MQATNIQIIAPTRSRSDSVRIAPEIDLLWTNIVAQERLVQAVHQYRQIRFRQLRNLATDAELEQLARLGSTVRGGDGEQPIIYPRFKCGLAGTLVVNNRGFRVTHAVTLVDISATGARVTPIAGIDIDASVRLLIPHRVLGDDVFDWTARVVWSLNGHLGMNFTSECTP